MTEETPEQTTRWRVRKIGSVLAEAGLPAFEMHHGPVDKFKDTVRQAGYTVFSWPGEHDCVYAEWVEHWLSRGNDWRYGTGRIIDALTAAGYTVEGPMTIPQMSGYLRVTRSDAKSGVDE